MAQRLAAIVLLLATPLLGAAKIKVGFINSITGPEAPIGENLTNGVALAVEDLRKQGIDVDLVKEDDTGKPEKAMAAFEKLATRDKVAGIVGPYTSRSAAAIARFAERYKTPLLIPAASKEEITRQGLQWTFRLSATTEDYATILLGMAQSLGRPRTMAIVSENTDFGASAPVIELMKPTRIFVAPKSGAATSSMTAARRRAINGPPAAWRSA